MKKGKLLKTFVIAGVFGLSYLGLAYSSSTQKFAGEEITVNSLAVTSQAKACETTFPSYGLGYCNSFGRCAYTSGEGNCRP